MSEGKKSPHIHIVTPNGECKFWLDPLQLAKNRGVSTVYLREMERLVYKNSDVLMEKFIEFH